MNKDKNSRNQLLEGLRTKLEELKKEGKSMIVGQNLRKLKKMKKPETRKVSQPAQHPRKEEVTPIITQSPKEKSLNTALKGIIKWVNEFRNFGFISVEGKTKDCFVHVSKVSEEIKKDFKKGILVEFETEKTDKGIQAMKVIKRNEY